MPTTIYPRRSICSPDAEMLSAPVTLIPKCWSSELRPLTFSVGVMDRLPEGEAQLALLSRCTAEGKRLEEVSAPGYKRQTADFHLHQPGRPTSNIHPVVFGFEAQPTSTIPLIGLFVEGELVMRGAMIRALVPPDGVILREPQMRFESGALSLRF